jgi:OOP family OmpA-OmpF porin
VEFPGRPAASIAALLLVTASLTACGKDMPDVSGVPMGCPGLVGAGPVAIVFGARANTPAPHLDEVRGVVRAAVSASQPIAMVSVEGKGRMVYRKTFSASAGNPTARLRAYNNHVRLALATFSATRASSPEANLLDAIGDGARAVGEGGTVVVLDSGLQTVAPLNFRGPGMLGADPAEVTASLRGRLPVLSKRQVIFKGLGDTAGPQPRLAPRQRANLIAVWQTLVGAAGVSCVYVDRNPRSGLVSAALPPVGTVPIPAGDVLHPCGTTRLLDTGAVGFVPGRSTFHDPRAATATLRQLAKRLGRDGRTIRLTGTTATTGTPAMRRKLSKKRAEAVKNVLARSGVRKTRMLTEGAGATRPDRFDDIGPGGVLLPGLAALNRSVIIEVDCGT